MCSSSTKEGKNIRFKISRQLNPISRRRRSVSVLIWGTPAHWHAPFLTVEIEGRWAASEERLITEKELVTRLHAPLVKQKLIKQSVSRLRCAALLNRLCEENISLTDRQQMSQSLSGQLYACVLVSKCYPLVSGETHTVGVCSAVLKVCPRPPKKKLLHVLLEYSSLRDATKPHLFAAAAENLNSAALSHSRPKSSPSTNAHVLPGRSRAGIQLSSNLVGIHAGQVSGKRALRCEKVAQHCQWAQFYLTETLSSIGQTWLSVTDITPPSTQSSSVMPSKRCLFQTREDI